MVQTKQLAFLFFLFLIANVNAQLTVDAELRPYFEYRHGFKALFPDNENPSAFVPQRTWLNTNYTTEKSNFYLSLQVGRVWGDVPQLNSADNNGTSIHKAWSDAILNENFALKLGRQEISYDDQRIFGSADWAEQTPGHEAALLRFSDKVDSGNNETRCLKTIGSHLAYKIGVVRLISNLYYQFGKNIANNDLCAHLLALEANYQPPQKSSLTASLHDFASPSEIAPNSSKQLGTEMDLVYSYAVDKNIALSGGYPHLLGVDGMESIKSILTATPTIEPA